MINNDDVPQKVLAAFELLVALERDIDIAIEDAWSDPRYVEALEFIFDELQLPRAEKCPINIADEAPPDWVRDIEEFDHLWSQACAEYRYHDEPLRRRRRRA